MGRVFLEPQDPGDLPVYLEVGVRLEHGVPREGGVLLGSMEYQGVLDGRDYLVGLEVLESRGKMEIRDEPTQKTTFVRSVPRY